MSGSCFASAKALCIIFYASASAIAFASVFAYADAFALCLLSARAAGSGGSRHDCERHGLLCFSYSRAAGSLELVACQT